MPGSSIGLAMNLGFRGTVARTPDIIIENRQVKADTDAIPFGFPVQLNSDNTVEYGGADLTAANFAGVAVAEVKQLTTYPVSTDNEGGAYQAEQPCDYLSRGIVVVKVERGTPTAGGAVYVRVSTSTAYPNATVGGFEAAADGAHTVELTNCSWNTGYVDANGMAELKIRSINN